MREFLRQLPRIRGMPWLLCAAAVGIFLLLFSGGSETSAELSYSERLEHKIAQMTETLPGVSDVSVLVTLEERGGSFSAYGADTAHTPKLIGVAVTCVGGGDARTRLEILHMLCAAFDLTADRVWVGGKETVHRYE